MKTTLDIVDSSRLGSRPLLTVGSLCITLLFHSLDLLTDIRTCRAASSQLNTILNIVASSCPGVQTSTDSWFSLTLGAGCVAPPALAPATLTTRWASSNHYVVLVRRNKIYKKISSFSLSFLSSSSPSVGEGKLRPT